MDIINKQQLINLVAKNTNMSKTVVKLIINETLSVIINNVHQNKKIKLSKFGNFMIKYHKSKIIHHPKTNKKIISDSYVIPFFKSSSILKKYIK